MTKTVAFTCDAGARRPSAYNRRMDAAIPKPARIAVLMEVAGVPEDCMCAHVVGPETRRQ